VGYPEPKQAQKGAQGKRRALPPGREYSSSDDLDGSDTDKVMYYINMIMAAVKWPIFEEEIGKGLAGGVTR